MNKISVVFDVQWVINLEVKSEVDFLEAVVNNDYEEVERIEEQAYNMAIEYLPDNVQVNDWYIEYHGDE